MTKETCGSNPEVGREPKGRLSRAMIFSDRGALSPTPRICYTIPTMHMEDTSEFPAKRVIGEAQQQTGTKRSPDKGISIRTQEGKTVVPLGIDDVNSKIIETFVGIENAPGVHMVIDTPWDAVKDRFRGLVDIEPLIERVYQKPGEVAVLDEGCGSSQTLFEAVEDIEQHKKGQGRVIGIGLTASPDILRREVFPQLRQQVLNTFSGTEAEKKRVELQLDGVQHDDQGYHRESPAGNTIQFLKADAHYLPDAVPRQKFDLIYSNATYSHLVSPWLAFEQACNALNQDGVLAIDAMPTREIVGADGKTMTPEEFQEALQQANPGYRIHFKSSEANPFAAPLVVEKIDEDDIKTGLNFATKEVATTIGDNLHLLGVYAPKGLKGFTSFSDFKSNKRKTIKERTFRGYPDQNAVKK